MPVRHLTPLAARSRPRFRWNGLPGAMTVLALAGLPVLAGEAPGVELVIEGGREGRMPAFRPGTALTVTARADRLVQAMLFAEDADGRVAQLIPREGRPLVTLESGRLVALVGGGSGLNLAVSGASKPGVTTETLWLVAFEEGTLPDPPIEVGRARTETLTAGQFRAWLGNLPQAGASRVDRAYRVVRVAGGGKGAAPVRLVKRGNLASDDAGDPGSHHDYAVVKDGVSSAFVWVPVFEAYQLIRPRQCGRGHADKPVGFWVANRPSSGTENVDWARETFGGFYAGKFEASHSDATPGNGPNGLDATEGSSSTLKVAPRCVPWTNVTWDQGLAACKAYDPACHLMEDDEWTALAVWSMIRGVTVYGNNSYSLSDVDDNAIRFVDDPAISWGARALTGTGTKSFWSGSTNLTTHTGTTGGVYDLNGNVWEWTATLGGANGSNRYTVKGQDTGISMFGSGHISSLSTDAKLRRYGVPGVTGSGQAAFGQDHFWANNSSLTASMRGGTWDDGTNAGVWYLYLNYARSYSNDFVGFRPVLRF